MSSILEGELADTIGDALLDAAIPLDVVIMRSTPGVIIDPADPPPPTITDHACKGFVDTYTDALRAASLVQADDVKVVIVAKTIDIVPKPLDIVMVRTKTYTVITVSTDPALALYELQARS
jgi:hypothetical protein